MKSDWSVGNAGENNRMSASNDSNCKAMVPMNTDKDVGGRISYVHSISVHKSALKRKRQTFIFDTTDEPQAKRFCHFYEHNFGHTLSLTSTAQTTLEKNTETSMKSKKHGQSQNSHCGSNDAFMDEVESLNVENNVSGGTINEKISADIFLGKSKLSQNHQRRNEFIFRVRFFLLNF